MNWSSLWPIRKNWLTRLLAFVLAMLIIAVLFVVVDRQVGNPLGCWYTEKKIQAHYNAYHPGRRYVVGPAKFIYADGEMRYVCHVYRRDSSDTGFLAYFTKGAVLSTEAAETLSGNNTYNRFKLRLNEEALTPQLRDQARKSAYGVDNLWADFYPGERQMVFSLEDPVFKVDTEYDRDHLPLPTVLMAACMGAGQDPAEREAGLAVRLRWLKELAEGNGQTFDYYSVQWYDGTTFWTAIDVPADIITPQTADAEEDGLLLYLKELPSSHKVNYYPTNSLGQQKSRLLYSQQSVFLPCVEHEG